MISDYKIAVIDYTGAVRSYIDDFISLRTIDIENDSGSWQITHQSKERAVFQPGDSICVYRNGIIVYGGVFKNLEENYNVSSKSWSWKAPGAGFNEMLKWRRLYPGYRNTDTDWIDHRTAAYKDISAIVVIDDAIRNNLSYSGASSIHREIPGIRAVGNPANLTSESKPITGEYRYDNVYDVVTAAANAGGNTILPAYKESANQIIFYVTHGQDLSNSVIFYNNDIISFKRILSMPEATHVVTSYNSKDGIYAVMWLFSASARIPGSYSYNWPNCEYFVKPQREEFRYRGNPDAGYSFNKSQLLFIAEKYAKDMSASDESFEIELDVTNSLHITYGYSLDANYHYITDYRIGDTIGFNINEEKFTGRVIGMEINVSYGKESMKPILGGVPKGKFKGILDNLKSLNQNRSKNDNTEIAEASS